MTAFPENNLGQLLILKLHELRWNSSFERFLRRLLPGGILVGAPLAGGAESTRAFLIKLAAAVQAAPFLAIEEEGGARDPLSAFLAPLPSPRTVAERGLAEVSRLGELVGAALRLLGFNTNLAPALDLSPPASAQLSETHGFSPDPQQVAQCGAAFLRGLERHRVLACGKHFPGLGSAPCSSATEMLVISKSMSELWREDLVPYRTLLIRLPLVLVSPAAYKAYDFDLLQSAGVSHAVVGGLLRLKLRYNGVAIACGLESEVLRGTLELGEAAVHALQAGCDALLVEKPEAAEVVCTALRAAFESGRLPGDRIEQALERIRLAKKGLKPPSGPFSRRSMDRVVREFSHFSGEFAGWGKLS